MVNVKIKVYNYGIVPVGKSNPITSLDRPRGFQEVEAPRFQDNQVVNPTHRPHLPP